MNPLNSVDGILDAARDLLCQAYATGDPSPVLLVCDTDLPGGPLVATWMPKGHPALDAAAMVRQRAGARWACLVVDAWVAEKDTADGTPQRGDARRAVEQGQPGASDALVATWVAAGCTPVIVTWPYAPTVDANGKRSIDWHRDRGRDSRYTEADLAGTVVVLLQAAIDAAHAEGPP
jgi:hypothetical protein